MAIPTVAFAAWSGTGKTTLIEKLILALKARGLRLAVIKHDAHRFDIDREGKDSRRFTDAGADLVVISSAEKTAGIALGGRPLPDILAEIRDVDLILVEGYKNENLPQIGISRAATGKGFPAALSRYLAVVTDEEIDADITRFALDDIAGITDFILREIVGAPAAEPVPSMDAWLREAKADKAAASCGMYLTHCGVVCADAKSARGAAVQSLQLSYDAAKAEAAAAEARQRPGIAYVRVWVNEGRLRVGDDMLRVLIGGAGRPQVPEAMAFLLQKLKCECMTEQEQY